jgi:hypothetical protein
MLDRLDRAPHQTEKCTMKRRRMNEEQILDALETILAGAMAAEQWPPAIRAAELLGKHAGLWRNDGPPQSSLAELINAAAANGDGDREQSD